MKKLYSMVTGLALTVGLLIGSASAGEQFAALDGIQAEAMSTSEMAEVEGKLYPYPYLFSPAALWRAWSAPTLSTQLAQIPLGPQQLSTIGRAFPSTSSCFFSASLCRQQLGVSTPGIGTSGNALIQAIDQRYGSLFNLGYSLLGW